MGIPNTEAEQRLADLAASQRTIRRVARAGEAVADRAPLLARSIGSAPLRAALAAAVLAAAVTAAGFWWATADRPGASIEVPELPGGSASPDAAGPDTGPGVAGPGASGAAGGPEQASAGDPSPAGSGADPPAGAAFGQPPAAVAGGSGGQLVVHVIGRVRRPGLVQLPAGSRVADAVQAAGGARVPADLNRLNLARALADGEQIAVGVAAVAAAGQAASSGGVGAGPGESGSSPVSLNTATEEQLDALPGIGPVLAGRIIAWRAQNGRFTRVEELAEVSGIGEKLLANLRPLVTV